MTPVDPERVVVIDDLVDPATVRIDCTGTHAGLRPLAGPAADLAGRLRRAAPGHVQVYLRDEVPERLHYRANPRIPPVLVLADEGWQVRTRAEQAERRTPMRGEHGSDNELKSMGGIFVARGPSFREGAVIAPVENIHVYNLLCAVLGLQPAPNDGDGRLAAAALRPEVAR